MQKRRNTNKQVLRTREWIFHALLELLESFRYEEIKITDIVKKADVARQTFYRNYNSKDDIIFTYLDDIFKDYKERLIGENFNDKSAYQIPFEVFHEHKKDILKIKEAGLSNLIFDSLVNYNKIFFDELGLDISDEKEMKKTFRIMYQTGGLIVVQLEWIKQNMSISPKKMGEVVFDIAQVYKGTEGYLPDSWKIKEL